MGRETKPHMLGPTGEEDPVPYDPIAASSHPDTHRASTYVLGIDVLPQNDGDVPKGDRDLGLGMGVHGLNDIRDDAATFQLPERHG